MDLAWASRGGTPGRRILGGDVVASGTQNGDGQVEQTGERGLESLKSGQIGTQGRQEELQRLAVGKKLSRNATHAPELLDEFFWRKLKECAMHAQMRWPRRRGDEMQRRLLPGPLGDQVSHPCAHAVPQERRRLPRQHPTSLLVGEVGDPVHVPKERLLPEFPVSRQLDAVNVEVHLQAPIQLSVGRGATGRVGKDNECETTSHP